MPVNGQTSELNTHTQKKEVLSFILYKKRKKDYNQNCTYNLSSKKKQKKKKKKERK